MIVKRRICQEEIHKQENVMTPDLHYRTALY